MALLISDQASRYFGYFTEAAQSEPSYDPGPDAPCPVCNRLLFPEQVITISVLFSNPAACVVSLFYRMHKSCSQRLSERDAQEIETRLLALVVSS